MNLLIYDDGILLHLQRHDKRTPEHDKYPHLT